MSNSIPTPPKSPRSLALSEFQRYGWVLGEPLSVLPKKRPTQRDVLRFWMHVSDTKYAQTKLSQKSKSEIINQVVKYVISHWMVQGFGVEIKYCYSF